MATPKKVRDAIVPPAGIYPPASAYHFIALDAAGVPLIDLVSGAWVDRKLTWNDFAIAHTAFNTPADVLRATLKREGRDWLVQKAVEWSVDVSPDKFAKIARDLEEHIIKSIAPAAQFDSTGEAIGEKKTQSDGQ